MLLMPALAKARGGQQRREPAADEQAFHIVVDRLAFGLLFGEGISLVLAQRAGQIGGVLIETLGPKSKPLVTLLGKPSFDLVIKCLRLVGILGWIEYRPAGHFVRIV